MKLQLLDLIDFLILTLGNEIFGSGILFRNNSGRPFTSCRGKWPALVIHPICLFQRHSSAWEGPFSQGKRHNPDKNPINLKSRSSVIKYFLWVSQFSRHSY